MGQALMGGGSTRFSLLLALVLMSAVVVNRHRRWIFVVSSIIGISSIGGVAYAAYFESPTVQIAAEILG